MPTAPTLLTPELAPARTASRAMVSFAQVNGVHSMSAEPTHSRCGAGSAWLGPPPGGGGGRILTQLCTQPPAACITLTNTQPPHHQHDNTSCVLQPWSIAAPTTEAAVGMPRAPTFLKATNAPAIRASLAMATLAHVSAWAVVAGVLLLTLSPRVACGWLAGRWGQRTAAPLHAGSIHAHELTTGPHALMLCVFSRGPVPHQQRRLQR